MKKKPRLVYVEWLDSAGTIDRWIGGADTISPTKCITVGFLKERTKEKVVICSSVNSGPQWGYPVAIPRCCITKMTDLK